MRALKNLSTSAKLTLGFGLLVALLAISTIIASSQLDAAARSTKKLAEESFRSAQTVKDIEYRFTQYRLRHYRAMVENDAKKRTKLLKDIDTTKQTIDDLLTQYQGVSSSAKAQEDYTALKKAWDRYNEVNVQVRSALESGDANLAAKISETTVRDVAKKEVEPVIDNSAAQSEKSAKTLSASTLAATQKARSQMTMFGICGVVFGALVAIIISRRISGTVNRIQGCIESMSSQSVPALKTAMTAMSEYDLTVDAHWTTDDIKVDGEDDLARMSSHVNNLVHSLRDTSTAFQTVQQNLRNIIADIADSSTRVSSSSQDLSNATHESTVATSEIASGSEKLALSSTSAAQAMEQVFEEVRLVSSSSDTQVQALVAANKQLEEALQFSEKVASSAAHAESLASESRVHVAQTLAANEKIIKHVADSTKKVSELEGASQEIGAIVASIQSISEQTNLLALNAAIEAARAGEHGRGFAVVADEVRKLAEQAGEATKQIGTLIESVRHQVTETVESISLTGPLVQESTSVTQKAGEALGTIAESTVALAEDAISVGQLAKDIAVAVNKVRDLATQNHTQTDRLAQDANLVTESIESVAAVSEETSAGAQELNATVEEVSALSQELNVMADQLDGIVRRFKVTKADSHLQLAA